MGATVIAASWFDRIESAKRSMLSPGHQGPNRQS
jgi:hypothetical protein